MSIKIELNGRIFLIFSAIVLQFERNLWTSHLWNVGFIINNVKNFVYRAENYGLSKIKYIIYGF